MTKSPKVKPHSDQLVFGRTFSDHMFICDYSPEKDGMMLIIPYQPLQIILLHDNHYGQSIFEGLKAYRTKDGQVNLYRPMENVKG